MAFLGADIFRGEFFFATYIRQIMFFCAKNIFSLHLAIMATGSANPGVFSYLKSGGGGGGIFFLNVSTDPHPV